MTEDPKSCPKCGPQHRDGWGVRAWVTKTATRVQRAQPCGQAATGALNLSPSGVFAFRPSAMTYGSQACRSSKASCSSRSRRYEKSKRSVKGHRENKQGPRHSVQVQGRATSRVFW
eukprot:6661731-Prymnesium_polylepis.2